MISYFRISYQNKRLIVNMIDADECLDLRQEDQLSAWFEAGELVNSTHRAAWGRRETRGPPE